MQHHLIADGLAAVATWLRRAQAELHNLDEIAHMSPQELEAVAADCGVSVDQFTRIVRRGPHAADELQLMLNELGLSMDQFDRATQREMTLNCADCDAKGTCHRSLNRGTAANDFQSYCANAERLAGAMAG